MSNNTNTHTGKQLSFFQLLNKKNCKIEIPIIQRDYAQGRKESTEIRNQFLDTIYDHLNSNKNIDLDFVYGSIKGGKKDRFIPLDGQQRLTTLFLLHWYLASKDDAFEHFVENFTCKSESDTANNVSKGKSKFTYETRTSSGEFCDALGKCGLDLNNLLEPDDKKYNSLSKTIKNFNWYYLAWNNDPTIKSMLTMLDSIHKKFFTTSGFYKRLIDEDNPIITFQFLDLGVLQLTDDLYIKMNARGKQLTPFENFKANFEQFIKDTEFKDIKPYKLTYGDTEKEVTVQEYFSHKIDTDWANIFWNYRNKTTNLFDDQLMNFIRVIATNHFASEKEGNKLAKLKVLLGKDDPEKQDEEAKPITFYQYKEIEGLDSSLVTQLISNLDLLTNDESKIRYYLPNSPYYEEEQVFKNVISNNLSYTQRINFYAFYNYIIANGTSEGLREWMRVISNLSDNTIYNSAVDFARSIKSVSDLLKHSSTILSYFSVQRTEDVSGFLEFQIKEELIKARLILKSEEWKNVILEAEAHPYFKGQIGFLLSFSGIEEYFDKMGSCDWSDAENTEFFIAFNNLHSKAASLFTKGGLIQLDDNVWERALLSKNDYLLKKGSNFSFLINTDRDISWKRLLRDQNSGKRLAIFKLITDPDFDTNNLNKSLRTIIDKSVNSGWERHFIKVSGLLHKLGYKRFIRWNSERSIYLLEKQKMSGAHREYYSYAFFLEHLKENSLSPFSSTWYHPVSGEESKPHAVIEGWQLGDDANYRIDIFYLSEDAKLKVKFFERDQNPIDVNLTEILDTYGFEMQGNSYVAFSTYEKLKGFLSSLFDSFSTLTKNSTLPDIDSVVE